MSYVAFTRMASLCPEIAKLTLTVGSAGKAFFLTGWRVGWVIGHESLIQHVTRAHIATCFSTVSPFQEAVAKALETPEKCVDFWAQTNKDMEARKTLFNPIWEELGLKVLNNALAYHHCKDAANVRSKYIDPEGGYFVTVDMSPLLIPQEHAIPKQYADYPYDCHVVWFLTTVIGVAAIPCSTFTSKGYEDLPPASVRFGFGRSEEELTLAKDRLRALPRYFATR